MPLTVEDFLAAAFSRRPVWTGISKKTRAEVREALAAVEDDLPLFEVLKEKVEDTPKNPALEKLRSLDVDSLSPREALDKLYELKADAAKGNTQGGF